MKLQDPPGYYSEAFSVPKLSHSYLNLDAEFEENYISISTESLKTRER